MMIRTRIRLQPDILPQMKEFRSCRSSGVQEPVIVGTGLLSHSCFTGPF
jgi:hypothetical protein